MRGTKIFLGMSVLVVFALALTFSFSSPGDSELRVQANEAVADGSWTFEGCWAYFSAGRCYDIYKDGDGNFWFCKRCGKTGTPNPNKCNPISQSTLNSGFWCS